MSMRQRKRAFWQRFHIVYIPHDPCHWLAQNDRAYKRRNRA